MTVAALSANSRAAGGHTPVLYEEALAALRPISGGVYIDCTVGGGGHAAGILERSAPTGTLLGLDADPAALEVAARNLQPYGPRVTLVQGNFVHLAEIARNHGLARVDGILFDLGVSSLQLGDAQRGFSFQANGLLDMRFDPRGQTTTAADLVGGLSERELAELLFRYGEERRARAIARAIVAARAREPVASASRLADIVVQASGAKRASIHPATRTFQALRIAVNRELQNLDMALPQALGLLRPEGRIVVISFHSLEDRLVKQFFARESRGCICPPRTPVCVCGHSPRLAMVTKKVVRPSREELVRNPRSRSARMRVVCALGSHSSSLPETRGSTSGGDRRWSRIGR